ncbi:MAG TPA: DNA methyltransferase [Ktedonobacteraceae bacterium]|nr:DNA methyltransferase [Ktedonobacteraceae bacterium]
MLQQELGIVAKNTNKLLQGDQAIHSWYRFVLSYPPHLVRDYLHRFGVDASHIVLDPFCGTGTTLVECKKLGIKSIGIEAHPMTCFASRVKTDWSPAPDALLAHARKIAKAVSTELERSGLENYGLFQDHSADSEISLKTLPPDQAGLILKDSISPLPLHKVLILLDFIEQFRDASFYDHERLALAQALVTSIGNLRFGPEVGLGVIKKDANVVNEWLKVVQVMTAHLQQMQGKDFAESIVYNADARQVSELIAPNSIDVVFTSPPYPNEKDYTRTTRLESVLLGFLLSKGDLRRVKQNLLRSNTRNVFVHDTDDRWAQEFPEIMSLADQIERRRIELQKTSGFERLYSRVTKLFFGGMARHLSGLRSLLRPGAMLGYVVGDQASYFQIMIRTGQLLARIAESLGYEVVSIDPFRTRVATATQSFLSEEVVVLRWPGSEVSLHYKGVEMSEYPQYDSNLFGEKLAESREKYMEDVEEMEDTGEEDEIPSTSRKKQDTRYGQIVEYIFFSALSRR